MTRSLTNNLTLDVRYIGTLGRRQWNSNFQINQPNFLFNGLKDAFDAARAGNDSSPALQVLENMFKGINIAGTPDSGPVGIVFNGVLQTAGAQLRASTATRRLLSELRQPAAESGERKLLERRSYSEHPELFESGSESGLPVIPAGVNGAVMRYNRFPGELHRHQSAVQQVYIISDINTNNYHSLEAQVTMRPTHGVSMQSTYTWSKNLGITAGLTSTYTDPLNRHADYAPLSDQRVHDFRTNGQFQLPIGPGKKFLGKSSGVLGRLAEGWQVGWIFNANTGQPLTVSGNPTMLGYYVLGGLVANGTVGYRRAVQFEGKDQLAAGSRQRHLLFTEVTGAALKQVKDPQCAALAASLQSVCTLSAIADASTGQILLQNAQPGKRGNMGLRAVEGPGVWRFDANLTKSFKVSEGKAMLFRIDSTDIFNHAEPATPIVDINATNFGLITGDAAKSALHRQFQASLRFTF